MKVSLPRNFMIDKQAIALINYDLELKWGKRFRLVLADDEFETRAGIVNGLEVVERLPKYSYLRGCFIFEKYFGFGAFSIPKEIKDWNGWDVIWAFEKGQTPNLNVCLFLADAIENGIVRSLKDHYNEDKKEFDAEVLEAYEILENESPYIAAMLHNKEAIVVPGKKEDA